MTTGVFQAQFSKTVTHLCNLLIFLGCAGSGLWLKADTTNLFPVADTTLFQTSPDNNLGIASTMICGGTANANTNRALIKFDIAGSLPTNATIQNVTLNVIVVLANFNQPPPPASCSLHRLLADWGEGTGDGRQGSPATPGAATWSARFYPDVLWSAPGAVAPDDYRKADSATQTMDGIGSYSFNSPDLLADVQDWFTNGATNFGWILICADETTPGSARRLGSREDPANTPVLTVEYSLPANPQLTVSLNASADTSLFELDPDDNLGASSLVAGGVGSAGLGKRSRALFQFSNADLPTDAQLLSATLNLRVTHISGAAVDSDFDLHLLLQPWGEGNKAGCEGPGRGCPASPGEATWNAHSFPSALWSAPGAAAPTDFLSAVSSTTFISGNGVYSFSNLLADVQFWQAHPSQNFGWILMSEDEGVPYTAKRFGSREQGPAPALQLVYLPVPRMAPPQISGNQVILSFRAQAGQGYAVQSRDSFSTGDWATFTNLPPSQVTQTNVVITPLSTHQEFFRVVLP